MRCWSWPGNTTDVTVLPQVKDDLTGWRLGRVITVVDRGFTPTTNLTYLTRAGGQYIAGTRMRDGNKLVNQALARAGRFQDVRDNLRVKEVRLDSAPGVRWVIWHNADQACKDKADRNWQLDAVTAELAQITAMRTKAARTRGPRREDGLRHGGARQGRVHAARPPGPRQVGQADPIREPRGRPGQDRVGGTPGR